MDKEANITVDKGQQELFISFALASVIITIPINFLLSSYSLLTLGLIAIFFAIKCKQFFRPPNFIIWLMTTYAVRILWIYMSTDFLHALKTLETESSLLLIPLIFSMFEISKKTKVRITMVYILMVIGVFILTVIRIYLYTRNNHIPLTEYFVTHFENSQYDTKNNILNWSSAHYSFLNVIAIYGLHLIFFIEVENKAYKNSAIIVYSIFLLLFIFFTGSRVGIALAILSLISYIVVQFKFFQKRIFILIVSFLVIVVLIIGRYHYHKFDSARAEMLSIGTQIWIERPLFGYGTGSVKALMHNENFKYHYGYSVDHPHNQYLTELIQFGIIGALPFFLFLIYGFYYSLKNNNNSLLLVLLTASVLMIIESPLNTSKGIVPFIFLVCFTLKGNSYRNP